MNEHHEGLNKNSYTYSRRPVTLIFQQTFIQFEQAEAFEKKIKKWSRAKKIALASNDFNNLKLYSGCKNKTNSENHNPSTPLGETEQKTQ